MQISHAGTSESAILGRVFEPDRAGLSAAAARAILALGFSREDQDRMRHLLAKAKEETLSSEEQAEINNYERVGHIISMMKSKARQSLKSRAVSNRKAKTH
jgi:hypothetical protein